MSWSVSNLNNRQRRRASRPTTKGSWAWRRRSSRIWLYGSSTLNFSFTSLALTLSKTRRACISLNQFPVKIFFFITENHPSNYWSTTMTTSVRVTVAWTLTHKLRKFMGCRAACVFAGSVSTAGARGSTEARAACSPRGRVRPSAEERSAESPDARKARARRSPAGR
jgi:hypothetical protein